MECDKSLLFVLHNNIIFFIFLGIRTIYNDLRDVLIILLTNTERLRQLSHCWAYNIRGPKGLTKANCMNITKSNVCGQVTLCTK